MPQKGALKVFLILIYFPHPRNPFFEKNYYVTILCKYYYVKH